MLDELPFRPEFGFPPPEVVALFDRARAGAEGFLDRRSAERVPLLVQSDPGPAWSILRAAAALTGTGRRFCEWGAGTGAVTCLAAQLGWEATGLDREPGLVAAAQALAAEAGVAARFGPGDYARARPAPGMVDPFAADLVYAYAWPAELRWLPGRFAEGAAPGTVLILYEGGITVRAYRKR